MAKRLDFKLFYWDVPFRGNFVQIFLEEVNARYEKHAATELYPEKGINVNFPGMAPPYLYDCHKKRYFAQMPAILMYLGRKYDYLPKQNERLSIALKTILDCNDILSEITRSHGMKMWDKKAWDEFRSYRLSDWMKIFERTGLEYNLKPDKGFLLGGKMSAADIAIAALFGTMNYSFPSLANDLRQQAPLISTLVRRIEERPAIQAFLEKQRQEYGRVYCGGQIEQSLREMIE